MTGATFQIFEGDAKALARMIPSDSIDAVITSPPYWGLRDYGHAGQIGLEDTPEAYVARMVEVFREIKRALRDDGTLWLNLGDSYAGSYGAQGRQGVGGIVASRSACVERQIAASVKREARRGSIPEGSGLKNKDLVGIPWRVAFALQADGWYLRQDIIWYKPNPMPESCRDRCTKAHEYIFLMSKSPRYYWNREEMQVPAVATKSGNKARKDATGRGCPTSGVDGNVPWEGMTANRRSVWTVTTKPFKGAHFATFPPDLVRPCIRAACPPEGLVLDPFAGAGTTLVVALEEGRHSIGFEINPEYVKLAAERIEKRRAELAAGYAAGEITARVERDIEPHDTGAALDFDPPESKEGAA